MDPSRRSRANSDGSKRVKTPVLFQADATECGAVSLAIVLGYHGVWVPIESLRIACSVTRDGSNAANMLRAARDYGLIAKGYKKENLEELVDVPLPAILFWKFSHFVVLEGWNRGHFWINDPATGPRVASWDEFDKHFTGIVLTFQKSPAFIAVGRQSSLVQSLWEYLANRASLLWVLLLVTALASFPLLLFPQLSKLCLDFLIDKKFSMARLAALFLIGGAGIKLLLAGAQQALILRMQTTLALRMATQFCWRLLRLPLLYFFQRAPVDLAKRVDASERIATLLSKDLFSQAGDILLIIVFGALMFQQVRSLSLITVLATSCNAGLFWYMSKLRLDANRRMAEESAKLMAVSTDIVQGIESLKANGREGNSFRRWAAYHSRMLNSQYGIQVRFALLMALATAITAFTMSSILFFGSFGVLSGSISIGTLLAFQILAASFMQPVSRMADMGDRIVQTHVDISRTNDVIQHSLDDRFTRGPGTPHRFTGSIALLDVGFRYGKHSKMIIDGLSLDLQPGRSIALVGQSGCGKSTVARLAAGLLYPSSGAVLFDGDALSVKGYEFIAGQIGFVEQDSFLFEGTVRDNLTLGRNKITEEQLTRAAKDACIYSHIAGLPGSFDAPVSEWGRNFSGGERQRLELARVLAAEPKLLILDEATSALDEETEQAIIHNIRKRNCSCIFITHRLTVIRHCDEIVVMENGRAIERGDHQSLEAQAGRYYELFRSERPVESGGVS